MQSAYGVIIGLMPDSIQEPLLEDQLFALRSVVREAEEISGMMVRFMLETDRLGLPSSVVYHSIRDEFRE